MASKNEAVAHVRVTIGGIEATQKHLNALRTTAQNTGGVIAELKKSLKHFMDAGDSKGASEVVKQINHQQNALRDTKKLIAMWEREVTNYTNLMEHLSEATVSDLNRAARDLQSQMKQTVTAEDTASWKKLNDAYREVMQTMDQLSGKAPNLRYVMENLGKVSNQSLSQSAGYLRQLIQETDRTTEKGRKSIRQWNDELKKVQAEQAQRAQKILSNKNYYSEEQIRSSMQTLQALQKDLRTGSKEWKSYADSIQQAKDHLDEYARKQKEAEEQKQKNELDRRMKSVISSPATASASELKEAIRYVEQLRDAQVLGGNEWQNYSRQVEQARQFISRFESDQRQFAMEDQLKNVASLSTSALAAQKKYWQEMVDGTAKGTMELQAYETMLAKVTAEEQKRAALASKQKEADMSLQLNDIRSLSTSALAEQKKFWKDLTDGAARGTAELANYQSQLAKVTAEEQRRADIVSMQEEQQKKRQMLNVVSSPGTASVSELKEAVRYVEQLRDAQAYGNTEWEKFNKLVVSAQQYMADMGGIMRQIDMENRLSNITSLSANALAEQKKYWQEMVDNARLGSDELEEYKQKLDLVTAEEQRRTQIAEQQKRRQMLAVVDSPSTSSVAELKEAVRYVEQLRDAKALGSMEWEYYDSKIRSVKESMEAVASSKVASKIRNDFYKIKTLSADALTEQKKFWQAAIDGADRNSSKLDVYISRLRSVIEEEKRRAAIDISSRAAENMDAVSSGTFTGSAGEASQAIDNLKAYRDSLSISTQADEINRATEAIKIYEKAIKSVKETVVDVQKVMANPQGYGAKEIEEAIRLLKEEGEKIAIGDTASIQRNAEAVDRLRKELEDCRYAAENLDEIIDSARNGTATVSQMERAVKLLNDRLAVTPSNQSDEIEAIRRSLDELNPRLALAKSTIANVSGILSNLDSASLSSLREAAKALKDEMENVKTNSMEFIRASQNLEKVKQRIKELEGGASALDKAFTRLKNWVLVYAGFSEAWNQVQMNFDRTLTLADQMSDVQKTTGLAADEVMRLSDEIQKIDTRIANEKLMASAAEAGRIGLSSREDVLGFVKASAVTLTALEELDEKAISSVMKLNELLGETKRLGVEQAILSTASSINELSQASAAAPEPIINFSRRFGGIALQANISTAQVLGLGATLDALNQPIEMSSTALNKFTTALITNGKAIAHDTGLSEEYYNSMLREGKTIELMIQVLSRLNSMGGLQNIAQYMKDMGSDGARMTQIISALAGTIPQLRANLELSERSFKEGTSVMNEYIIKNENAAALMERIGNIIKEYFANSTAVKALTDMLSVVHRLVTFMTSGEAAANVFNGAVMLLVGTLVGSYKNINDKIIRQLKEMNFSFRTLASGTRTLITSVNALGKAFKRLLLQNPIGWILAGTYAITQLIPLFSRTRKEMEGVGDISSRIAQRSQEAAFYIAQMTKELKKAADSIKDYSGIVAKLNLDYKDYLGHLVSESAGYREIAAAIDVAAAAQRRKIIEDERANVTREVNDKYREKHRLATTQLYADVVTDEQVFVGAGEKLSNDLFAALVSGISQGRKKGEIELSAELKELLTQQAELSAKTEIDKNGRLAQQYGGNKDKLTEMYYNLYLKRIKSLDSVKELVKVNADKQREIEVATKATDAQLSAAYSEELKARANEVDAMMKALRFVEKEAKDYTEADEELLRNLIQASEHRYKVIRESNMDPAKKTAMLKREEELVTMLKKKERDVLLAFVENPLKGYDFRVDDNGKLLKKVDENGKVLYKAVEKLSDADLDMLRRAYLRTEETLSKLVSDNNGVMDSAVRDMGSKLSKVKTAIKNELNDNGLLIDEKGVITLSTKDTSESDANRYSKEMQRTYRALLSGLEEYFTKEKQLANEQYINSEMTHEQHQKRLDEIERKHLLIRSSMQKELVSHTEQFDEKQYFASDPKLLSGYGKVKAWMPAGEHNFQATVKADAEKGLNEIKEMTISTKEEIEKILLDNSAFVKTSRQYQQQLEELGIFFINMDGISADNFKGMQDRATQVMALLSQAAKDTTDMSYETFRNTVASFQGVGDLMLATQQQDGSLLLQGTEEQWQAIYAIIMRYNNDIDDQRTQLFEKNKRMVSKLTDNDETIRSLSKEKKSAETSGKKDAAFASWGTKSERGKYSDSLQREWDMLDVESQIYLRKYEIMKDYYDKRIEQEDDMAMRAELKAQRDMELAELENLFQEEQVTRFQNMTELYTQEYDRRLEKATEYADRVGEFAAVMAQSEWNSVEDRKRAGEELARFMAEETKKYILELLTRSIKRKVQEKLEEKEKKMHETRKTVIEQQGEDTRNLISQIGGKTRLATETAMNQVSEAKNMAHNAKTAGQDMVKTQVSKAQGEAGAASKIFGELGWWGMPLIALVSGLLNMLLSSAMSSFSSAYGSAEKVNGGGKRLAAGMLTYAEGRYPVRGNDGQTYDAEYEPVLETGIYDGGGGKAHFGIFSEKMPEMVVSGPTTRIIQQDYPQLLDAIMTIDRHGRIKNAMPTFADGNMERFSYPAESGSAESPAFGQDELMQAIRQMNETNMALSRQLSMGIRASINMYGKGGAKESMDKADKFYRKNKIKN